MKRLAILVGAPIVLAVVVWMARLTDENPPTTSVANGQQPGAASRVLPIAEAPHVTDPSATTLPVEAQADVAPLALPPVPRVAGFVVRASDGSALDGVVVTPVIADPALGLIARHRVETRGGRFDFGPDAELSGLSYLTFTWSETASVRAVDVIRSEQTGRHTTSRVDVDAAQQALDHLSLTLDTGWNARGHVQDAAGQPLAKAFIETSYGAHFAFSGDDGAFIVRDLPREGWNVTLVARLKGYADARVEVPPPVPGVWLVPVDFTLVRAP